MRSFLFLLTFFVAIDSPLGQVTSTDWSELTTYPGGRIDDGVGLMIGDSLFMGTGIDASFTLRKDWWRYTLSADEWTRCADIPGDARQYAAAFASEHYGYLMGGILKDNLMSAECFRYDPVVDQWFVLPPAPWEPRGVMCAFSIGNSVYLAGGRNDSLHFNDLWRFDLQTEEWQFAGLLPFIDGRDEMVGFSYQGYGYLIMGRSKTQYFNTVYRFDPYSGDWTNLGMFPGSARTYAMATGILDGALLVGGQDSIGQIVNETYYYDANNDEWQILPETPIPIRGAHLFSTNKEVITFGGLTNNFSRIDKLYHLTLLAAEESEGSHFRVEAFPNPVSGVLQVKSIGLPSANESFDFQLINSRGEIVIEYKAQFTGGIFEINTDNLESGLYTMHIRPASHQIYKKLVVIK